MRVGDADARGREALGMGEANALKGIVDDDDAKLLAVGAGLQERALNEVVVGVGDNDVVVGDHVGGRLDNDKVGEGDALVDEVVNGLAELLLGGGVGQVNVDFADLQLEPADGVAHGEAHGAAGGEVVDLRAEDLGGEVS